MTEKEKIGVKETNDCVIKDLCLGYKCGNCVSCGGINGWDNALPIDVCHLTKDELQLIAHKRWDKLCEVKNDNKRTN